LISKNCNYSNQKELSVQEKILESIVIVESASGVLIYQNKNFALILTAAHVLHNEFTAPPYIVSLILAENGKIKQLNIEVLESDIDDNLDLAILKTKPLGENQVLVTDVVSFKNEPRIGDEIYVASNPHHHYRSLKRGILSSKLRFNENNVLVWEVDAMIIFGSSGGGAFTKDGKLFGIVSGIDALETDYCWGITNLYGEDQQKCLNLPLPNMGYVVSPDNIRHFLLNSSFSYYFKEGL
jgi:S1-C subfamily serine protease